MSWGYFSMTNKSGKNGRKPLTTRQRAFIKELSKGQSAKDAAIAAGYAPTYARQQGHQAINRIKKNCAELFDEAGITDRALIDKNILPALEARVTKAFNHPGKVIYSKPLPAHDIRLRATEMVLKLKGAYPAAEQQHANVGVRRDPDGQDPPPDRSKFIAAQENDNGNEPLGSARLILTVSLKTPHVIGISREGMNTRIR
jgi:hypothetical protein